MTGHRLTRSATRRSGDAYQDLVAAEVILEFLRHPSRYEWVKLEVREAGKLDDVLALRRDGVVEATQVKYSTDAMRPGDPWTWENFLEPSNGGTSWLQDWCHSVKRLDAIYGGTEPRLVSNRRRGDGLYLNPDNTIDIEATDESTISEIHLQLRDAATDFLTRFRFEVDQQDLVDLEDRLRYQFEQLGVSEYGWLALKEFIESQVLRPGPSGSVEIRLPEIQSACRWRRLKPLPQNVEVPDDYTLPPDFHEDFLQLVDQSSGSAVVLTAGPGIGKSTYLSYLVQELEEDGRPVIRHHYALNSSSHGSERLDARRVAESLMADISAKLGSVLGELATQNPDPGAISSWISKVGSRLQGDDRHLVVVIDGLDHVWREEESRDELNRLFNWLIPVPEGVVLVVGTQPVSDSQLPLRLIEVAPRDEWTELPNLDAQAINEWLIHYRNLFPSEWQSVNEAWHRSQLANSLHSRTAGHPLLLRYSVERIAHQGELLTVHSIEAIPEPPANTVEDYYRALWVSLAPGARDVVFLLAVAKFPWPGDSLYECLQLVGYGRESALEGVDAIRHLLGFDALGARAFHSSLLMFATLQSEFQERAATLRTPIIEWLNGQAPEYWRRSHLWLLQQEGGDTEPLLSGSDRQWTVQALAEGHPVNETALILQSAAWQALEVCDFRAYVDRGILSDVLSATDIQDETLRWMFATQLHLSTDDFLEPRALSATEELPDLQVLELGLHLLRQGQPDKAAKCLTEMNRRIRRQVGDHPWQSDPVYRRAVVAELYHSRLMLA